MTDTVRVIDSAVNCPELPIIQGGGVAKAVIWPGTGAQYRTFQMIALEADASTVPLQHESDAAYYVVEGAGHILDLSSGERQALGEGGMVHIDAADRYQFVAQKDGMRLLGGPCPADESLYAHLERA